MVKTLLTVLNIYNRSNKNYFKKSNSKTAEETGDLIGNKIADKITSASKSSEELYSAELRSKHSQNDEDNNEIRSIKRKIYISRKKGTNY